MARYFAVAEVVALHDAIMVRTGHAPEALRDEGLLEPALARARNAAHYEEADLVRQAVLMATGMSHQLFIDGNKRAAYATFDVFLRVNHQQFTGSSIEMAKQFEIIAEAQNRDAAIELFESWLRERVQAE